MDVSMNEEPEAQRFNGLVQTFGPRVFAYVRRHVERDAVEDIVAETFLITWRRLAQVPEEPLPWLLVVARNTLANHRRRLVRRERVQTDLAALERVLPPAAAVEDIVVTRSRMLAALADLTALEREAVLLTAWDGLTDLQAAQVSGCSPRAFRVRLHRARQRIDRALSLNPAGQPGDGERLERLHLVSLDALLEETS
jgi:RNA polymerase sigma factor (sigma-70 family)